MNYCIKCKHHHHHDVRSCASCGFSPSQIDGIDMYSPELALESPGFKSSYFAQLAALESENFWFKARNSVIKYFVRKYSPNITSYLEIGCGTGVVLSSLKPLFKNVEVFGSEIFLEGLKFARLRCPGVKFMQLDALNIPFRERFDLVGAFDVLEHIEHDVDVMSNIYNALKPGGIFILTVPQHMYLWSYADEYACHKRRYEYSDLRWKLESAGFTILESTSFIFFLLPLMALSRYSMRKIEADKYDPAGELGMRKWLNNLLFYVCALEAGLLKLGIRFRWGGTRILCAKK